MEFCLRNQHWAAGHQKDCFVIRGLMGWLWLRAGAVAVKAFACGWQADKEFLGWRQE